MKGNHRLGENTFECVLLGELFHPMAFEMLAYIGRGLGYHINRCRNVCTPLAAVFSFYFPLVQRTATDG